MQNRILIATLSSCLIPFVVSTQEADAASMLQVRPEWNTSSPLLRTPTEHSATLANHASIIASSKPQGLQADALRKNRTLSTLQVGHLPAPELMKMVITAFQVTGKNEMQRMRRLQAERQEVAKLEREDAALDAEDKMHHAVFKGHTHKMPNRCRGQGFFWRASIRSKCISAFGRNSVWDTKEQRHCVHGYETCQTHLFLQCCSQPEGPKRLDTYCKIQAAHRKKNRNIPMDPACKAQPDLVQVMNHLTNLMKMFDALVEENGRSVPAPQRVMSSSLKTSSSATTSTSGALMPPGPVAAQAPQPNICQQFLIQMSEVESDIARIQAFTTSKQSHHPLKIMRQESEDELEHLADPDLQQQIQSIVDIGIMLKNLNAAVCSTATTPQDVVDDDTFDGRIGDNDRHMDDGGEVDDTTRYQEILTVNKTALVVLSHWLLDLKADIEVVETEVHPHGQKWWRYRYEYCCFELLFLVPCIILTYSINITLDRLIRRLQQVVFECPASSDSSKWAAEWQLSWVLFLMQHATAYALILFVSYLIPTGAYDSFALCVRELLLPKDNVNADVIHLPYLGITYHEVLNNVVYTLVGVDALYSLFWGLCARQFAEHASEFKESETNQPDDTNLWALERRIETLPFSSFIHSIHGKTVHNLRQTSMSNCLRIVAFALIAAHLAARYRLSVEALFVLILRTSLIFFLITWMLGRYLVARACRFADAAIAKRESVEKAKDLKPLILVNHARYTSSLMLITFILFYSFSRLMLTSHIWHDAWLLAVLACAACIFFYVLIQMKVGDILGKAALATSLPSNATPEVVAGVLRCMRTSDVLEP